MTIEEVKNEMINRGCSKAQTEGKYIPMVISILTKNNSFVELSDVTLEIEQKKYRLNELKAQCSEYVKDIEHYKELYNDLKRIEKEVSRRAAEVANSKVKETNDYLDKFFSALEECETKEGRDALKRAQMFVNSVNVDTKYDNTEFIKGLASILSVGNGASMEKLDKITEKIEEIPNECGISEDNRVYSERFINCDGMKIMPWERKRI